MRAFCKAVNISIRMEIHRLVKVRAYNRIRNGKIERVRTHYRRYSGTDSQVTVRL